MTSKSQLKRVKTQSGRLDVVCLECGHKFKTASVSPQCSKCNSVDIDLR